MKVGEIRHRQRKRPRSNGEGGKDDDEVPNVQDRSDVNETSKRNRQDQDRSQPTDNYFYLFPEFDDFTSQPIRDMGGFDVPSFNQNRNISAQPNNMYSQNFFGNPGYMGTPLSGQQMYQGSMNGQAPPQADFSGFGLTVPPNQLHTAYQTGFPAPQQANSAAYSPRQAPASSADEPDEFPQPRWSENDSAERQRQLREAVAKITNKTINNGPLDGPDMSPEDIENKRQAQKEMIDRLQETDGPEMKTDAFQVGLSSWARTQD